MIMYIVQYVMTLIAVLSDLKRFYTKEGPQFSSTYLIRTKDLKMANLGSFAMALGAPVGGGVCKGQLWLV